MATTSPYLAQQPVTDFGHKLSTIKYSATLTAATVTSLLVPQAAPRYKAVIKGGIQGQGQVWFTVNQTPAVPSAGSFTATTSEMVGINQTLCREVKGGDTIRFISAGTGVDVSVVLYALGSNS